MALLRALRFGGQFCCGKTGGAGRDRTGDLLNANQALSQLSYSPKLLHMKRKFIEANWTLADRSWQSTPSKSEFPSKRDVQAADFDHSFVTDVVDRKGCYLLDRSAFYKRSYDR